MSENPAWRCGHARTIENTVGPAKGQCRECHRARSRGFGREAYRKLPQEDRYLHHRRNYLPRQIAETEHKLVMLRNEAARLGMLELLSPERQA